jgi:hypothetical protein
MINVFFQFYINCVYDDAEDNITITTCITFLITTTDIYFYMLNSCEKSLTYYNSICRLCKEKDKKTSKDSNLTGYSAMPTDQYLPIL